MVHHNPAMRVHDRRCRTKESVEHSD
jgi:hypothetical protein